MDAPARTAVVVGGAGFVGRRVVARLVGGRDEPRFAGAEPWFDHVHVVDVAPWVEPEDVRDARARSGQRLTHAVADVRDLGALRAAFAGAHTVFHLASIVHVGLRRDPRLDAVNVGGTENVIAACRDAGVAVLVYTSSEDVVLSGSPVAHGDERLPYPTTFVHDYVRTKVEGERLVLAAHDGTLATCALRPQHVYGPEDPHAIVTSLRALAAGRVPFRLGDGSARFGIVYVDNVAHAHLLAARRLADPADRAIVGGQAYFVGEDRAPNYFDFLAPYATARGLRIPERHLPAAALGVVARALELVHAVTGLDVPFHRFHVHVLAQDFFFSHARAARELGYRPIVDPAEGERRTVAWVRTVAL